MSGTVGICAQETARYTRFATSLARLELPAGWQIHEVYGPYIAYSRQALAENFEGEYLLFMDDYHVFAPDLLRRLLRAA
jgi:hypothetical protein